jgi:putative tributyrin esterase
MALIHCDFFSESLGLCTSVCVILPQRTSNAQIGVASAAGAGKHKTLYLLHGLSDDHTIWQRRTSIERYVAPLGLAVVMPRVDRSFYCDMADGLRYFTYVTEELPAVCRSFFPLSDAREDNFVAGLSMGGYGAMKVGLTYPDRYAAAASLSGALDMGARVERAHADDAWARELTRCFGPIDDILGSDNDLMHLADEVAASDGPKPRLFAWCGTEDFLYDANQAFRAHVDKLGLGLTYEEGPGGHSWDMWDAQIQRVLEWLELPAVEGQL